MNEEVKTLTLSEDVLQRFEPDPLESIMLNSANKEAMIFARAIIFLAPMFRFNPREYQITIKYEVHTNSFKAFCTPSEEAYYGFITPSAKFRNLDEALSGCGGLMNGNWNL